METLLNNHQFVVPCATTAVTLYYCIHMFPVVNRFFTVSVGSRAYAAVNSQLSAEIHIFQRFTPQWRLATSPVVHFSIHIYFITLARLLEPVITNVKNIWGFEIAKHHTKNRNVKKIKNETGKNYKYRK